MDRKVILYIAMSIDGFIARKNGDVDWLEGDGSDEKADMGYEDFYEDIDTVIMGRTTYEQILTFGEYPYKGSKGYVYTSKDTDNNEDVVFTKDKPEELIDRLKKNDGKNIWVVGGSLIIDEFIKKNLIDEYVISIIPTILGDGIPLFRGNDSQMEFKLDKHEMVNGIVLLYYSKRITNK